MKTFLLILALLANSHLLLAASPTAKKVESSADIISGGLYMLTYYNDKEKKYWVCSTHHDATGFDYVTEYNGKKVKESKPEKLVGKSQLLQFIDIDGKLYLKDWTAGKFLKIILFTDGNRSFDYSDTPAADTYVEPTSNTAGFHFIHEVDGIKSYFQLAINTKSQRYIISTSKKDQTAILLYRIDNVAATMDETKGAEVLNATVDLNFNRNFSQTNYSTLMVPFDIADYKQVFGAATAVYEVQSATTEQVTVAPVSSTETLKAYQPYLIRGASAAATYTIPSVAVNYDGRSTSTKVVGDFSFTGVFGSTDIGQTESYVLSNDQFYICNQTTSVTINPFHWYLTMTSGTGLPKKISVAGLSTTTIATTAVGSPAPDTIYNLQGIQQNAPWQQLPKGIYIRNGKKVVKY